MPGNSDKKVIREFALAVWGSAIDRKDKQLEEDISTFIWLLEFCRYTGDRPVVPKSMDWIGTILSNAEFGDKRFRTQLRMERYAFAVVLSLIKGNIVNFARETSITQMLDACIT